MNPYIGTLTYPNGEVVAYQPGIAGEFIQHTSSVVYPTYKEAQTAARKWAKDGIRPERDK